MFHLNDIFLLLILCYRSLYTWRIEDILELLQNHLRSVDAANLALIQESHSFTTSYLIQVWCRSHDGNALFPEHEQHFPQFLAAHRVHTRGRLVQEQYTWLVN